MKKETIIAPSLLAADFRNLESEVARMNHSAAEWVHFDVMDGVFVPNISFGFPVLQALRALTDKFIDAHLMIEHPAKFFGEFKKLGANHLTIHFEGNSNLKQDLIQIRELGMSAGLVLNPDTDIQVIEPYLPYIDLLLIMSVFPGFGGQKFIEATFEKVRCAKDIISKSGFNIPIQVDGGVSVENSKQLIESGADVLVSGSALFKAPDFSAYVLALKTA